MTSRDDSAAAVEVVGVRKAYRVRGRPVMALDGLSLTVPQGVVFGLLGPNGAGKSTLLRVLLGITRPDAGRVSVFGQPPDRENRAVGYAAQESELDPYSTPGEILALFAQFLRLPTRERRPRIDAVVERLALGELAGRPVLTLSGGQKKRLELAIALLAAPRLLLLDEPTLGLDPVARADLWQQVLRAKHEGITAIVATHALGEIDPVADHVGICDHGRLIACGTPETLKASVGSDRVSIRLVHPQDTGRALTLATGVPGLGTPTAAGDAIEASSPRGQADAAKLIARLAQAGIEVAAVAVHRPSLDEVYRKATGHEITNDTATADGPAVDWAALKGGRR